MMSKGPLERRERLLRVCKSIIADPRSVDAGTVADFKATALRYANTQYGAPEQVLERLYCGEDELGGLMRGAVDVVVSKSQLEVSPATGALYSRTRSFLDVIAEDDDSDALERDDDDDDNGDIEKQADHHASTVADLLVEAGSFPHRAAALHHLLHKPEGQALLRRMHKAAEQTAKETSMKSHSEFVQSVVKQYGVVALAKSMVQD